MDKYYLVCKECRRIFYPAISVPEDGVFKDASHACTNCGNHSSYFGGDYKIEGNGDPPRATEQDTWDDMARKFKAWESGKNGEVSDHRLKELEKDFDDAYRAWTDRAK